MPAVEVQQTPNPRARRFLLDRVVQQGARGQVHTSGADHSDPAVAAVLRLPGVQSVMTLPSSVTVSVGDAEAWPVLEPQVVALLTG